MDFETTLKETSIVAILRGICADEVPRIFEVLYRNGIRIAEIPLNRDGALSCIQIASEVMEGRMIIGAGTVLTAEDVEKAQRAGAKFMVSPNTDAEVIYETKRFGLLSMPGIFTATEAFEAIKAGADYLKLFPAVLGAGYIKDLKAVVPKPILAIGGITKENMRSYLQVCHGVGIGSAIYKPGKRMEEVDRDTKVLMAEVLKFRKGEP